MTAAQAVGNGSSLGMRYLEKLIWKIPMLVDRDDNDGNPVRGTVSEAQAKELHKLYDQLPDAVQKKALVYLQSDDIESIRSGKYDHAIKTFARALKSESEKGTVTDDQEATLIALIEGIGGTCKADFLAAHKIKKVSELPAGQYQGALKALQERQRG